jgi:hypothetical protein
MSDGLGSRSAVFVFIYLLCEAKSTIPDAQHNIGSQNFVLPCERQISTHRDALHQLDLRIQPSRIYLDVVLVSAT